jgi:hypothetical protein
LSKITLACLSLLTVFAVGALPATALASNEDGDDRVVVTVSNFGNNTGTCQIMVNAQNLTPNTAYFLHADISVSTPMVVYSDSKGVARGMISFGKGAWLKARVPSASYLQLFKGTDKLTSWSPSSVNYANTCK